MNAYQKAIDDFFLAPLEERDKDEALQAALIRLPELHESQREILDRHARFKVWCCGRQYGKTTGGKYDLCLEALTEPAPYAWFAPTFDNLMEVWRDVAEYILVPAIKGRPNKAERRLELVNGSTIKFWSLASDEIQRGRNYRHIWMDEAALVSDGWYTWESVIMPMLIRWEGRADFFSTPRGKLNWFYKLFQQAQSDHDYASFQLPTWLNPYIPASEIERMRRTMLPDAFAQEVEALFRMREGAVFSNWDELENVTEEADYVPGYPIEWWCDAGWSNPTCILLAQERPFRGMPDHVCVFAEFYESQTLPQTCFQTALDFGYPPPEQFMYDPAAPTFAAEFDKFREGGNRDNVYFSCQMDLGNNTVRSTDTLRKLICDAQGVRRFRVHPRCVKLKDEIPGYHYSETGSPTRSGDRAVVKDADHACFVAGTLITTATGQRPIESLKVGDLVLTRAGWYPVSKHAMTQEAARVMTVTFENGKQLTATPDHPVWVEGRGFVRLDSLRYGIMVASLANEVLPCQKLKPSNIGALPTAAILTHLFTICVVILCVLRNTFVGVKNAVSIGKSIKMPMVKFQTAFMSTMQMAIRSIMTSQILSFSAKVTIINGTLNMPHLNFVNTGGATLQKTPDPKPANGIVPQRGGHGIASMLKKWSLVSVSLWNWFAITVASPIKGLKTRAAFVPMRAKAHGGAQAERIKLPSSAKPVAQPSTAASMICESEIITTVPVRVLGVENVVDRFPVYAITVSDPVGEYFANGFLSKNCDAARYGQKKRIASA